MKLLLPSGAEEKTTFLIYKWSLFPQSLCLWESELERIDFRVVEALGFGVGGERREVEAGLG